jgi:hypothetical protein
VGTDLGRDSHRTHVAHRRRRRIEYTTDQPAPTGVGNTQHARPTGSVTGERYRRAITVPDTQHQVGRSRNEGVTAYAVVLAGLRDVQHVSAVNLVEHGPGQRRNQLPTSVEFNAVNTVEVEVAVSPVGVDDVNRGSGLFQERRHVEITVVIVIDGGR